MSTVSDASELGPGTTSAADSRSADAFDPSVHFDQWLRECYPGQKPLAPESPETHEEENSEIYIGSFPGSNCEVTFEGVLHFDGYSIGNISSPDGTLVLTKRGRIEADINVGVAVIGGCVTGNITATERVVLESEARVTGQIQTPVLSVKLGAVFDGDCLFTANTKPVGREEQSEQELSDELEHLAVGAGV